MVLRLQLATTFWRLDNSGSKVVTMLVASGEIIVETVGWECDRSSLYILPDGTHGAQAISKVLMEQYRAVPV